MNFKAFTELPWTFGGNGNAAHPLHATPWTVSHPYGDLLYCSASFSQAHIRLHHHVIGIELNPGIVRTQFNDGPVVDMIPKSHSAYFLPAGSVIEVRKEYPTEFMLVTIDPERLGEKFPHLAEDDRLQGLNRPISNIMDARLAALAATIRRQLLQGEQPRSLATDLATTALESLSAHLKRKAGKSANMPLSAYKLRRVLQYIGANFTQKIMIEDIASAAGNMSPFHFAHTFKAALGQSPYQYILDQRLRQARDLLVQTDNPLAEIACATGFYDQAHMTEMFRRKIGITPAKMRNIAIEGAADRQ